jgi:hypothetical protein
LVLKGYGGKIMQGDGIAYVVYNKTDQRHELWIDYKLMAYVLDKHTNNPKQLLAGMAREKGYKVEIIDNWEEK